MCKQYLFMASAVALYFGDCAPPPSLNICKSEDAKCIKEATNILIPKFANGMPEYNVEVLDPLVFKSINASQGNILLILTDITINGLKNCEAKKIYRDEAKSKIFLKLQCTVTLDGDYVLDGSLTVVPVKGKGKLHAHLKSAIFDLDADTVEKTGDDGKKHWHIKSFQNIFDLKEKADVVFENLNSDNEILRQASADLLRENSNTVIKEIASPVIKTIITRIVKNVNHFFKAISAEDLSVD